MAKQKVFSSVREYIDSFPIETRAILEKIQDIVKKTAPGSKETISYNILAFDMNAKHLVFIAGWKNHISLYPAPSGNKAFNEQIEKYKNGKGTLHFPLDQPIPYNLIEEAVVLLLKRLED